MATPTTSRADLLIWALIFLALGFMLLVNRPIPNSGPVVATAVVSFAAASFFLFLLIVRRR